MNITFLNNHIAITEAIRFAFEHMEAEMKRKAIDLRIDLQLKEDKTITTQGYHRTCRGNCITIASAGEAGMMYGILDLEREICHAGGIEGISDREVKPYLNNRGIKLNIPLDARTPSYSDSSDSATNNIIHMWEYDFWTRFLDHMALERYNVLSLWTLSPFPSLVSIPEYPEISLQDVKRSTRSAKADLSGWGMYSEDMEQSLVTVKKMTIEEKIAFWQSVMDYAANRCISIYLFTWNLFVYGTEHNGYGITCDQNNQVTRDYIYCGTKALMDTYPKLAGLGVTSGEHMVRDDTDIAFLRDTYAKGVKDYLSIHPNRSFELIHRMQYTRYESIMEGFHDFPCALSISFKYSQAHMYSGTKPAFIKEFLKEKRIDQKIWLTVRNDDYYMYRYGDPEYAREYLRNMPSESMNGYYMGADGYTWGRDYMDLKDGSHPLFIEKMWYMFCIWGQLSYDVTLPKEYFCSELACRFDMEAEVLSEGWSLASQVIPIVNQIHWHDYDFQWYPEGCCMYDFDTDKLIFADINEFVKCINMPGGEYYSIAEYCETEEKQNGYSKKDPLSGAKQIRENAEGALLRVEQIRSSGNKLLPELTATMKDIEAMSLLGFYYSDKIKAAVSLCRFRMFGGTENKKQAVSQLREAAVSWKKYSALSKELYTPQLLTRLCSIVDVQRFDILAELDVLLAEE
ncbi:MAG: hypothetical protein K0R46_70 [Herbinix sp.]|nr:hypothetical protein [Herbinix sp.]